MSSGTVYRRKGYQPINVEGFDDPEQTPSDSEYVVIDGPNHKSPDPSLSAKSMKRMLTQVKVMSDQRPQRQAIRAADNHHTAHVFVSTKWIVLPIFILFGLGAAALIVLNLFNLIDTMLGFAILLGISIIGGGTGALFVWRFGTVEQVIDFMGLQNKWYEATLDSLAAQRENLQLETGKVAFEVSKLKKASKDLKKSYAQFEELRRSLAATTEDNEHVLEMVETLNALCDETKSMIQENQRAQLMSIYYDLVSTNDTETGEIGEQRLSMTEKDYQRRFLSRLDKELRMQLDAHGGFGRVDRDGDGTIDKDEFINLINEVLDETQGAEERHLETLRNLQY